MSAQNSRAKILINAFEKQIEVAHKALEKNFYKTAEGKIASLERSLASIKKKDPSFNTSRLEKKLDDLKERCGDNKTETLTSRKESRDKFDKKIEGQKIMGEFMSAQIITQELADKVIAADKSFSSYSTDVSQIIKSTEVVDRNLARFKVNFSEGSNDETMENQYNDFKSRKLFWQTSATILPEESSVISASQKYNDFAKTIGSLDDIRAKSAAFNTRRIANKRMPSAAIKDVKIENLFKKAFDNESADTNWQRTSLKINLTNRDWVISKNNLTGAILGRKRYAAIAFKDIKTGKCKLISDFTIYQQYNGSGYNEHAQGTSMVSTEILCENINK
ncbi:hypothetical protein [Psychroserpens sp.]|uniref:hypothetical protein n=1 Tax=Psychroserpens sp. TaxID=2020870 RepID=UPI002B27B4AD|nr:hypothetical protein [Psychroserpens sp.]